MMMQHDAACQPIPEAVAARLPGRSRTSARPMLYDAFEMQCDMAQQTRAWGRVLHDAVSPWSGLGEPVAGGRPVPG